MSVDSIGNFLTIIRNGLMVAKPFVVAPYSRMNAAIADILKEEGFIRNVVVVKADGATHSTLKIFLKYVDGESVIHEITRVSKPSRRLYAGMNDIKPVIGGLGLSIITTSKGVISHKQAKKQGIGGEILCTVW